MVNPQTPDRFALFPVSRLLVGDLLMAIATGRPSSASTSVIPSAAVHGSRLEFGSVLSDPVQVFGRA